MAASISMLETVELLEKILLCLPILDIVRIQRVNHLWTECIENSILLQRKLFRSAIPAANIPRSRTYSRYTTQPVKVNPLLLNIFSIRHSEISGSSITVVPPRDKRRLQQACTLENVLKRSTNSSELDGIADRPLVLDAPKFYNRSRSRISRRSRPYATIDSLKHSNSERRTEADQAHSYRYQSWALMLATQPPLQTLNLRCDTMGGSLGGIKVSATHANGITLKDITEAAAEFYRTCGQQSSRGFRYDPEMTIYQPLKMEQPRNADGYLLYSIEGQLHRAYENELIGFQRAWKTKLRCNLG